MALAPTALEYLGHVLPRAIFKPVSRIFEPIGRLPALDTGADAVAGWIRAAWDSEDGWLRACAVRAARHVPAFDLRPFATATDHNRIVRAELAAMSVPGRAMTAEATPC